MLAMLFFIFLLVSYVLTDVMRKYSVKYNLLDVANQRSMHVSPTPRGGGVAIVFTFVLAMGYLFFSGQLTAERMNVFLCAMFVAAIGFWDDHNHVPSLLRFGVHLLTACLVLWIMPALSNVTPFSYFSVPLFAYLCLSFFLVWCLNLFNFMDGIDGIAASETLFFGLALSGFLYEVDYQLFQIAIFLAASAAGFLCWNRPKAKIFMGDVGSGFLGLLLGVLVLMAAEVEPVMFFIGMILFGIFFVDASYTLMVRMITRQSWAQPHCSHTYQIVAKQLGHAKTLFFVWMLNVFWLLPIAVWVFYSQDYRYLGLVVAYLPLIFLAFRFKAGIPVIA